MHYDVEDSPYASDVRALAHAEYRPQAFHNCYSKRRIFGLERLRDAGSRGPHRPVESFYMARPDLSPILSGHLQKTPAADAVVAESCLMEDGDGHISRLERATGLRFRSLQLCGNKLTRIKIGSFYSVL